MNSNTRSEWSDSVLKPWSWMIMICFVDFNRLFGCMILDWPFLTFQTFHRVAVQHPAFTTCCAKPLGTLAYGCSSNIFLCSPLPENILIHIAAILHDLAQVNICKPPLFQRETYPDILQFWLTIFASRPGGIPIRSSSQGREPPTGISRRVPRVSTAKLRICQQLIPQQSKHLLNDFWMLLLQTL